MRHHPVDNYQATAAPLPWEHLNPGAAASTLYQCATTPQQGHRMAGNRCRRSPGAPCINAPPPRNRAPHDREPVSASPRSTLYQCATTPQQGHRMAGNRCRRSPGSPCINAPPPHNRGTAWPGTGAGEAQDHPVSMRHHPGTERRMTGSRCRQAPGAPCINAPPPHNRGTAWPGTGAGEAPGAPCINAPPPHNRGTAWPGTGAGEAQDHPVSMRHHPTTSCTGVNRQWFQTTVNALALRPGKLALDDSHHRRVWVQAGPASIVSGWYPVAAG